MNKVKIIKTTEGYMVELPDGDYLCDEHGDNTWETRGEAEDAVAINYVDLNNYIDYGNVKPRLLDAQLSAYPDSIVLTDHQMYDALRSEIPSWLIGHEFENWDKYEARYEMGVFAGWYYDKWKDHQIEETRARWARNALLYKWQTPDGFFYACCKKEDGTYRYVGFRYGVEDSQYASGFDGMGYTPQGEK